MIGIEHPTVAPKRHQGFTIPSFDRRAPSKSSVPKRHFSRALLLSAVLLGNLTDTAYSEDSQQIRWPGQDKTATITGTFKRRQIRVRTSSRTAGAIDSITWNGNEFVDRNDHGREFQSASSFFSKGECFNPTEAGSDKDGRGDTSTSKLLELSNKGNVLHTKTQMAFWIGPHTESTKCHGTISTAQSPLSDDELEKRVSIGIAGIPNAIEYDATFIIPESRTNGGFEAVAGYMPAEFSRFWTYDMSSDKLSPIPDTSEEQSLPVIFATTDGSHAIGIYSPHGEASSTPPAYGAWRFTEPTRAAKAVKWNCYFREHDVTPGPHEFKCYIFVGSLSDVRSGMMALRSEKL